MRNNYFTAKLKNKFDNFIQNHLTGVSVPKELLRHTCIHFMFHSLSLLSLLFLLLRKSFLNRKRSYHRRCFCFCLANFVDFRSQPLTYSSISTGNSFHSINGSIVSSLLVDNSTRMIGFGSSMCFSEVIVSACRLAND